MVCGRGGLSGIHRGGIIFGGLGLQSQTDGSSVSNVLKVNFTEWVTGAGKAIFEGLSSLQPLRQGRLLNAYIKHYRDRKTGLQLHPLKSIKNWGVN